MMDPSTTGRPSASFHGLPYSDSRSYNPAVGRFVSMDSISLRPGDLLDSNLYAYVGNNPTNLADPSGHSGELAITIGALAVTAALLALGLSTHHLSHQLASTVGHLSFNPGISDEISGFLSSGEKALVDAGIIMMGNTAVVAQAIGRAMAKARAALGSIPPNIPIFPIFKRLGPAVFWLDVTALAINPSWYLLNYNGPGSPVTLRNRAAVWSKWGWTMSAAPPASQLDEFPYASTRQGGPAALAAPVPWNQNAVQGGMLSAFYRYSLRSTAGASFMVVPIPI